MGGREGGCGIVGDKIDNEKEVSKTKKNKAENEQRTDFGRGGDFGLFISLSFHDDFIIAYGFCAKIEVSEVGKR